MEYAVVVCKRVAIDNFPALVSASPAMRQAMLAVTKGTFDKLVLKAEGFIISGVEGTHLFMITPIDSPCSSFRLGALAATGAEGKKKAYKSQIVNTIRDLFSKCSTNLLPIDETNVQSRTSLDPEKPWKIHRRCAYSDSVQEVSPVSRRTRPRACWLPS